MAVEPQVQQFIDFIRDEMPRRIKTNPNSLPDAEKLLVSVSGTLEVIYKTLAELDIAIKSDVDTELSNKEPSITAGSNTQYWRGDKTFQTLNTDAVPETASRVFLSPAQKTIATQAASSTVNGYLSSTDWSTFNSKKSLPEVKSASFTAEINKVYSLGTPTDTLNIQFPTGTVTGQEIITHINRAALTYTVNAVPATGQHVAYVGAGTYQIYSGFCDHILRWVFNSSNSAWELLELVPAGSITDVIAFCSSINIQSRLKLNLPAATGTYNWYTPAKNINFGDLPNVATTDSNNLSGTRNRILGGSGNTVSGTDNVAIACNNINMVGSSNTAVSCAGSATPAQATEFAGTGNTFTSCSGYILGTDCTLVSYSGFTYYANLRAAYNTLVVPKHSSVVFNTFGVLSITSGVYANSGASSAVLTDANGIKPVMWINKSFGNEVSEHIVKIRASTISSVFYGERKVLYKAGDGGTPLVTTIGTDIGTYGMELTVSIVITATGTGNKDMSITVQNGTEITEWTAKIESTHF